MSWTREETSIWYDTDACKVVWTRREDHVCGYMLKAAASTEARASTRQADDQGPTTIVHVAVYTYLTALVIGFAAIAWLFIQRFRRPAEPVAAPVDLTTPAAPVATPPSAAGGSDFEITFGKPS